MGDNCYEDCAGAPFDCTCCNRMCEPYSYDEEKQEWIYKDLFRPKTSPIVLGNKEGWSFYEDHVWLQDNVLEYTLKETK